MSIIPESAPFVRSREHIDRICDLLRRYWKAHPMKRFEQAVNDPMPDYHYNSDDHVEAWLRAALDAAEKGS